MKLTPNAVELGVASSPREYKSKQAEYNAAVVLAYGIANNYTTHEIAYALATAGWETAWTYAPITEYGGVRYFDKYDTGQLAKTLGNTPEKDGDGYRYRGRGHVQITGLYNYRKFQVLLNKPIVANPDLVLDFETSLTILYRGIKEGLFRGKSLAHYMQQYGATLQGFSNARGIINADVAKNGAKIGEDAMRWYTALNLHDAALRKARQPTVMQSWWQKLLGVK